MSSVLKRLLVLLILFGMLTAVFTGCGASKTTDSSAGSSSQSAASSSAGTIPEAPKLEEVTLNIVYPGDNQPDQATVNDAIEKASKDELNIKLNYQYVPWGDYEQKVRIMLTAGDGIDIFWSHPTLLASLVKTNSVLQLDELLAKVGNDLTAGLDEKYWPPVKFNGKTYGVPAGALGTTVGYLTFTVRQDLREKYGLAPIKTEDEFLAFLEAVKKNNPEMIPLTTQGGAFPVLHGTTAEAGLPVGVTIDLKTLKAEDRLVLQDYLKGFKFIRDLYVKDYITKDILSVKDYRADFNTGKAASAPGDVYEYNNFSKALTAIPGTKAEFVKILLAEKPWQNTTTWNFQSVAAASKKAERAVMYLNWAQKDQKNYDLLTLGVENVHYVLKDGNVNLPEGKDAVSIGYNPYEWLWQNPKYMKAKGSDAKDFLQLLKDFDKDSAFLSPIMGFTFDPTPVKTEVAALDSVAAKYQNTIASGLVDPEIELPKYDAAMKEVGLDKVIDEVQKQLDAFLASKK